MLFEISQVTINPIILVVIGFVIGILGGFFGVGGGFLAGPLLFSAGMPMNMVVGTDLAHMTGKSIVAAKRHSLLGHIDLKLGGLMVLGTIIGVESGAQIIERLKESSNVDMVIGVSCILISITYLSGMTKTGCSTSSIIFKTRSSSSSLSITDGS